MQTFIPIVTEETNIEILARISKATSKKWGCTMCIDFFNGNRTMMFSGDPECRPVIVHELEGIFHMRNQTGKEKALGAPSWMATSGVNNPALLASRSTVSNIQASYRLLGCSIT